MSILGTRVVCIEDPLFLTHGATYNADLVNARLVGAVHATFVRSQVAHGRVLSVDASAARGAPGVVAVVTAEDIDLDPIPAGLPMVPQAMTRPRAGVILPTLTMLMAPAVYDVPKVHAQARVLATNTTSVGAYRGAGRPEATAAAERAIDRFAAEIGMDPADVRRKNLLPKFDQPHTTPTGAVYDSGDYAAALDTVLEEAGYAELRAEQARRRADGDARQIGIGMSVYVEITGADVGLGSAESAELEVHPDGTATVLTGTSPHGQGHATTWAMLASEQLGIPIDKITVVHGDTDRIPLTATVSGCTSRTTRLSCSEPYRSSTRGKSSGRRVSTCGLRCCTRTPPSTTTVLPVT